jgi:hypothetical protein
VRATLAVEFEPDDPPIEAVDQAEALQSARCNLQSMAETAMMLVADDPLAFTLWRRKLREMYARQPEADQWLLTEVTQDIMLQALAALDRGHDTMPCRKEQDHDAAQADG